MQLNFIVASPKSNSHRGMQHPQRQEEVFPAPVSLIGSKQH